jgi:hypothetical protein
MRLLMGLFVIGLIMAADGGTATRPATRPDAGLRPIPPIPLDVLRAAEQTGSLCLYVRPRTGQAEWGPCRYDDFIPDGGRR